MPPAVRFEQVTKTFGSVRALDGISLDIAEGETVALLGPNGAGKSTAIGIMLGLRRPDRGTAHTLGADPATAVRGGRIGAMLQTAALPPGVTVAELVDCVRGFYPRPLTLSDALSRADLTSLAARRVEALSGGQAQRVRFALAIAGDPELIFLDEPTSAMDVGARRAFWEGMRAQAAQGHTVLFATHHLDEVDAIADRVVVMQKGRVIADGAPGTVKAAAGARTVRFTLQEGAGLPTLPGVAGSAVHGGQVILRTGDSDALVRALIQSGVPFRDLEVAGAGLEEAFVALTEEAS